MGVLSVCISMYYQMLGAVHKEASDPLELQMAVRAMSHMSHILEIEH